MIHFVDGYIGFPVTEDFTYDVSASEVNTLEKLLAKIEFLREKRWFTSAYESGLCRFYVMIIADGKLSARKAKPASSYLDWPDK